ncbi:ABC transporter permease [Streptomonospora litoralis]|uniref:Macrolide export ATP-binding/permease protein MacB n=1 Tax=Streptomonospora litoralis TaxID=2498135 RepID=A0A4P6PY45_9ACTN|nr:FtsX-like permease family protein [Streptomonospora litoralis]QBI53075.1 Macrolide export ATP-binding/permease protein MacB [Streptomonospora litoralis]
MLASVWAQIRTYPARLVAILIAITLGVAFLAATAVFASTSSAGLRATAAAPLTQADVVVQPGPDAQEDPDWYRPIEDGSTVSAVAPMYARTVQLVTSEQRATTNVYSVADAPGLRWFDLARGRWPSAPDEVLADTGTLEDAGLSVGSRAEVVVSGQPRTVRVVGAADVGFRPLTGVQYRFYASTDFFTGSAPSNALVEVADRASIDEAVAQLESALPGGYSVNSAERQAELAAERFAGGSQQLEYILLAFALISLLAAAMVIGNTFTILMAQRRRDTALLRLIGAEQTQVRRLVLTEAALVGSVGSLLGVALGVGAGYLGASLMSLTGGGLRVDPVALIGAFLVGVAATMCAAWLPARRAASIPPIEAMATAATADPGRSRIGLLAGVAVVVLGGGTMAFGAVSGSLPLALAGGFLSAVALLFVLKPVLARLFPLIERLLRGWGGTAELAGANLRRNAGRAATTTLTLVLGTALIVALFVAAQTGQATVDNDLRNRYPVDVSARASDGAVSERIVEQVSGIDGLVRVEPIETARFSSPALGEITVAGVAPGMRAAVDVEPLGAAGGGPVMLVSQDTLTEAGLAGGDSVSVSAGGETQRFTVRASNLASVSGAGIPVVRSEILAGLATDTRRHMVWGIAAEDADRNALGTAMSRVAAADADLVIAGSVSERRDIAEVLDILLNLAVAMLLITVVIAVIGVVNTLGLSVLERQRESALLRALGLTRRRLGATLAIEAVVISLVGALTGLALGLPYGLVGVDAVVGAQAPLVVEIPWARFGIVVAVAVVAGVAASLVPARQIAKTAPAEGLSRA